LQRLPKHWGEEKQERRDGTHADGSQSGFAHETLLGKKFSCGRNGVAIAVRQDHGKQGVLRKNSRTTHRPD
jgi:hypothetical protein